MSRQHSGKSPDSQFCTNLDEARRFLELLDPSGAWFTFQTFPDKGSASERSALTRVLHGAFTEHSTALTLLNRQGTGIFVMVNEGDGKVHPSARTCRTAKNVIRIRAVFVDLDGSPIEPVLDATVAPSVVVESSPGHWHAYWLLSECPLDQFKPTQAALAAKFGGDPKVIDLPRVMRLPGFLHQKGDPFMTRIVNPAEHKGK